MTDGNYMTQSTLGSFPIQFTKDGFTVGTGTYDEDWNFSDKVNNGYPSVTEWISHPLDAASATARQFETDHGTREKDHYANTTGKDEKPILTTRLHYKYK